MTTSAAAPVRSLAPSFWLDHVGAQPTRPALEGEHEADVCIVGGGFTGLWTAYELRRAAPELEVVVLEAEHVGFGASGRNGGWVLGALSGRPAAWRRRGGPDAPALMTRAIQDTVAEVGSVIARESIDCAGIRVARSPRPPTRFSSSGCAGSTRLALRPPAVHPHGGCSTPSS